MTFKDELKKEYETAYKEWFVSWLDKYNPKKKMVDAAKEGSTLLRLETTHDNLKSDTDNENFRRLKDKRILKLLTDELGEGIKVEHQHEIKTYRNILGSNTEVTKTYLTISWGE